MTDRQIDIVTWILAIPVGIVLALVVLWCVYGAGILIQDYVLR